MIKTFEQYNSIGMINEGLMNKGTSISPKSAFWQKAIDLFKNETGKDLKQFNWVFVDGNTESGIWPQWLVVALFKGSPMLSKYKTFIKEFETILNDDDLSYHSGVGSPSTFTVGSAGLDLNNSEALYMIWIEYFYLPIKDAIQKNNFNTISIEGMEDFEERMKIYTLDLDSDWKNFFRSLRISLESVSEPAPQEVQQTQPVSTSQPATKPTPSKAQPTQPSTPNAAPKRPRYGN